MQNEQRDRVRKIDKCSNRQGRTPLPGWERFLGNTGWSCKNRTAASHSSTGAVVISLDAGVRPDGIPPLGLWDIVIDVSEPPAQGNLTGHPKKQQQMSKNNGVIEDLDLIPSPSRMYTHPANVRLCSFSKIMTQLSR